MQSFKESGDYRVKQIWSRVTKEDKKKSLPSDVIDYISINDDRDDYVKTLGFAGQYFCQRLFNMTAIQIDLGNATTIINCRHSPES